ncbi:DUF481 domain-containing protein [Hyphomonas sp. WL0036]|uniref:DUF481 domain-containing protein n=1 Tax=Hyphomonas sediminis TaxID=2866160 RepID=UPI001C80A5D1|nr:DUF481 domain-containing protein [Hyphomonas sediminis]MBY9068512.1 DUF481 domain-containing protein [Hyphomonas sediminis]
MQTKMMAAAGVLFSVAGLASAQTATWQGEGSLSAGVTTGNTDTRDLGLGLKLNRDSDLWRTGVEALADYGEIDGAESKNRIFLAGQLDRKLGERAYVFGRGSYEADEFSGFDSRIFLGGGAGYTILTGEKASWSVEGGPGIKIDEVKEQVVLPGPVIIPAETVESFSVVGASKFAYAFNENVKLSNDTSVLYAEESTQLTNSLALTAALTGALSARVSFDVRHDTNPPIGFEDTDTATRVSLVYAFGS